MKMKSKYRFSKDVIELNHKRRLTSKLKRTLEYIQKKVMKEIVFSRFKYYTSQKMLKGIPDSKYSVLKYKEGNCVGFAYYTQFLLKKYGFKDAVIIGSSPPAIFKRPGYLYISHAATILPYNKGYILFDGSFYYSRPVYIDVVNTNPEQDVLTVKNVYSKISEEWTFSYHKNDSNLTIEDEVYNNGECIVTSQTPYISVAIKNHNDRCNYYLRELTNPDESITVHTNKVDKRIFYCKVTDKFEIDLYYAFDENNDDNKLRGKDPDGDKEQLNLDDIDSSNMKTKFKKWCNLFTTSHEERKKMLKHIQKYYKQYYLP